MRRTRRSLIAGARRLTAERGLAGFTVDELCAEVGISRRSFFNYFASKDDAVLGTPARDPLEAFGEEFVAGGSAPDGAPLLSALQELVVRSFALLEGPHDRTLLLDVLRREPVLLQRLTETMERRLAELTELIARRQGCGERDPFPGVAAAVVSHLAGHTVHELLETRPAGADPDESPPLEEFAELLARNVRLAGALLSPGATAPQTTPDTAADTRSATPPDTSDPSPDTEGSP
ncbi:TetR/AcrR family transcriptional regulator [Kocuria rosea]|uniref:TetR/AcrR family transcriptional regulator n=1 Tax=Kocuria rosea TaxID=1275 RepID=UPI000DFACF83|nr:TetR/AcrR family transcriptional regulator [Kocuria rosea]STX05505.1 mycofactocin system transcriptional regulator [Kocuria rosea]